jgi:hypothetical protein
MMFVIDIPRQTSTLVETLRYRADMVISMSVDVSEQSRYQDRYIEVSKARYQPHIKGKHLFKVIGGGDSWKNADPLGARPIMREGGVYVFPSAYYVMSEQRSDRPLVVNQRLRLILSNNTKPEIAPFGLDSMWEIHGGWGEDLMPTQSEVTDYSKEERIVQEARAAAVPTYGPPLFPKRDGGTAAFYSDMLRAGLPWPLPGFREKTGCGLPIAQSMAVVGPDGLGVNLFCGRFLRDGVCAEFSPQPGWSDNCLVVAFGDVDGHEHMGRLKNHVYHYFLEQSKSRLNPMGTHTALDPEAIKATLEKTERFTDERLHIIHQKPGPVSVEEFLHRIAYWIAEFEVGRVWVSGIRDWKALYPRLAETPWLFSALTDMLEVHRITSVFSAADGDAATLGLLGLATTVVRVSKESRLIRDRRDGDWIRIAYDVEKVKRGGASARVEVAFERDRIVDQSTGARGIWRCREWAV